MHCPVLYLYTYITHIQYNNYMNNCDIELEKKKRMSVYKYVNPNNITQ